MKTRRDYNFYVYILANYQRSCFYVGFTNDIVRRIIEHQNGFGSFFTIQYKLKHLIYFEEYRYVHDAINREKEIKKWSRDKKINLVKTTNPFLSDLSEQLLIDNEIDQNNINEYCKYLKDKYKNQPSSCHFK